MKIVILDGHAINPGDLSWEALRGLGELEVLDRTSESDVLARARDAEVLLTMFGNQSPGRVAALPL